MQFKNSHQAYGIISIAIHWLMALLIVAMFALGVYMVDLTYMHPWYTSAPHLHTSIGMLLLLILVFRLFWRLTNPLPILLGAKFEQMIALLVHRMHYVLMFTLMVSGYLIVTADGRGVAVFNWFEVPALFAAEKGREDTAGLIHMFLAWGLMGFVALHAAAALKHHFIDKDRTLLRMLGIKKQAKESEYE